MEIDVYDLVYETSERNTVPPWIMHMILYMTSSFTNIVYGYDIAIMLAPVPVKLFSLNIVKYIMNQLKTRDMTTPMIIKT